MLASGMDLALGESLPSLCHLDQEGLLPRIDGHACVLQTTHSVSLAVSCNRHVSPLTNERSEFYWCRVGSRRMGLGNHPAPRFGLQKVGGLKPGFGGLQKFPALFD
jgi:hypothetical protein